MSYRALLRAHGRFLMVGFGLCFFSSFGQTYFIGVFGGVVRRDLGLSHAEYGGLYSVATLLSGCSLLVLGRGVDRYDLRVYTGAVCAGLAVASFMMAAAQSVWLLFVALFALRLSGQGLMGHIAMTSMARYFEADRAKALSVAAVGFAIGEALWPRSAIIAIEWIGWRGSWIAIGVIAAGVVTPGMLWLLRGHDLRHRAHLARLGPAAPEDSDHEPRRQWTRAAVVGDPRFYMVLPAALAPAMIVTGMFFHQVRIAELQGWTMEWYATCFVAFAFTQLATALVSGPLIDRFGANRLFPFLLVPMGAGLCVVALGGGAGACLIYLVLTGVTIGATSAMTGALWAEAYGVVHLGSIRAMTTALMVGATALTPVTMGFMLDAGASVESIAFGWVGYSAVASLLAAFVRYGG